MGKFTPHDITVILLAMGVLLGLARLLGELAMKFRQPAVIGEILAGIILGPTILGRIYPEATAYLFPMTDPASTVQTVQGGVALIAVVMFMLVAGMEVDLSRVFRQGRAAVAVSLSGILFPFALGFGAGWGLPEFFGMQAGGDKLIFALFLATAMSISALPVIAKTLMDLNLYRSDMGMVVIAAAIFDDLAGWLIFAVILAMMGKADLHSVGIGWTILFMLSFAAVMLTAVKWVVHQTLPWLQAHTSWPGGVLAAVLTLALCCAALTEWIGVHAIFGSFIAGIAMGDSSHLRQRTRLVIDNFISFIFAPLFFGSIGVRVDMIANFNGPLVAAVFLIACAAKLIGCGMGAKLAGMSRKESLAVGFGMNARGAMEIILGLLAREAGLIGDEMFVALVLMAMMTSMMSGPLMQATLRTRAPRKFSEFISGKTFLNPLKASDREAAIRELAGSAAAVTGLNAKVIEIAVRERERMMPTALGHGVAVPHARLASLRSPLVAVGLTPQGIDFAARDGELVRLVLMILTPQDDDGLQLEILADIARTFREPAVRERALEVTSFTQFLALIKAGKAGAEESEHAPGAIMGERGK